MTARLPHTLDCIAKCLPNPERFFLQRKSCSVAAKRLASGKFPVSDFEEMP